MKEARINFSRLYHAALQTYLKQGEYASMGPAHEVGRRAMTAGLETLDMARIHEIALVSLVLHSNLSSTRNGMMGRAAAFFAEALTPIEETHRSAKDANTHLKVIVEALSQRSLELAASNEELKLEIAQNRAVENSLRISEATSSMLLVNSREMQEELRLLSHRLLTVQEEERKRISRELHDVIAQSLTGINVRLSALKSLSNARNKDLNEQIVLTQKLVENSVEIVHRFARDLRPTVLDDLGLIPALQLYLKDYMEQTGIRTSVSTYAGVEELDNDVRNVLYRVAQEALTNVSRHAKASLATISIHSHEGFVCMVIHDNGHGFKSDGIIFAKGRERLGLLGMRERVEMIGGTFCVESAPGKETTIKVEIPSYRIKTRKRVKKSSNTTLT